MTLTVNVNSFINNIKFNINSLEAQRLDILAICEMWLTNDVPNSYRDVSGYSFLRKDVAGTTTKHGVGLYIRKNIQAIMIDVSVANTLVVHVLEWDTFIIVSYRPPSYNDLENDSLRNFLSEFCIEKNVLMLGDFNLPRSIPLRRSQCLSPYITYVNFRSMHQLFALIEIEFKTVVLVKHALCFLRCSKLYNVRWFLKLQE